jgi:predicted transcriptional regulator
LVRVATVIALISILVLLISASAVIAEEKEDDDFRKLIDELNKNQDVDGSWDQDPYVTTGAMVSNSYGNGYINTSMDMTLAFEWATDNYQGDSVDDELLYFSPYGSPLDSINIHSQSYVLLTVYDTDDDELAPCIEEFAYRVDFDLIKTQNNDGSWNNDPGDTGIAVYSRAARTGKIDEISLRGINWLLENEDKEALTWGEISDDSKAILALDSAGYDMWEEIAALMLKQRPDGSFGGIEETSWAVIAMSTNLNDKTMESMERAMTWLRSQEYENNEDLANAALAEQYYERAKRDWDPPDSTIIEGKGGGTGTIPPPMLIVISMFIISGIALGFYLFARIEKEAVLSGIRKDMYTYIERHPGEHLAHLTKKFDISSSSARYHLSVLEGMDQIVSHKSGKYKRFYINKNGYSKYTNGNGYKHIMSALKNITARRIVKFILSNPDANQKRVSEALKLHPSTVNWHAERLRAAEVLSKQKKGKEIVYTLNEDVQVRKVIGILEGSLA